MRSRTGWCRRADAGTWWHGISTRRSGAASESTAWTRRPVPACGLAPRIRRMRHGSSVRGSPPGRTGGERALCWTRRRMSWRPWSRPRSQSSRRWTSTAACSRRVPIRWTRSPCTWLTSASPSSRSTPLSSAPAAPPWRDACTPPRRTASDQRRNMINVIRNGASAMTHSRSAQGHGAPGGCGRLPGAPLPRRRHPSSRRRLASWAWSTPHHTIVL